MSSDAEAMMCSWNGLKSKSKVAPLCPAKLGTVASTRPGLSCWKMPSGGSGMVVVDFQGRGEGKGDRERAGSGVKETRCRRMEVSDRRDR